MSALTLVLVALGVSADAFAVAVGKGLERRRRDLRQALVVAAVFGAFQAGMPLLGWFVGSELEDLVTSVDHWVAFVLLAAVGGRMLHEALAADGPAPARGIGWRELLVLALATSVDALAVGITFAFLPLRILPAVLLIGATTAVVSFGGVLLGQRAGARWRRPAELAGGVVLIGIGVKILLDHLSA